MNNHYRKSSLQKPNDNITINSPSVSLKSPRRENKIDHLVHENLDQKLRTLRMRILGSLLPHESRPSKPVPVVVPLKPMPYVRHFNVTVSLKKSRLLRFFSLNYKSIYSFVLLFFIFSHRNSNAKQWSIGKKQFNENPKEVRLSSVEFYQISIYLRRVTVGLSKIIFSKILPNIWLHSYSMKSV